MPAGCQRPERAWYAGTRSRPDRILAQGDLRQPIETGEDVIEHVFPQLWLPWLQRGAAAVRLGSDRTAVRMEICPAQHRVHHYAHARGIVLGNQLIEQAQPRLRASCGVRKKHREQVLELTGRVVGPALVLGRGQCQEQKRGLLKGSFNEGNLLQSPDKMSARVAVD